MIFFLLGLLFKVQIRSQKWHELKGRFQMRNKSWSSESTTQDLTSVADPEPGSGIGCLFDPWIRDGRKSASGSGMNNPDRIFESLETIFLLFWGLKYLNSLMRIRNRDPGWRQFGSGIRDGKKSDPQHWLPQNARIRRNTEHKTLWFPKRTYFHANLVHIRYRSIIVIYVSPLLFVIFRLLCEIIFNSNCTFLFYLLRKALSNCAVLFLLFAAGIIVKLNRTILLNLPRDSLSNQALFFFLFVVLCRGNHCQIVPYGSFLLYSLQNF